MLRMIKSPKKISISPEHRRQIATDRRMDAMRLRLDGKTIKEVSSLTGLSCPTIISLQRNFQEGGWGKIKQLSSGRPRLNTLPDANKQILDLQSEYVKASKQIWDLESFAQWLSLNTKNEVNTRSAARILKNWGWAPPSLTHLTRNRSASASKSVQQVKNRRQVILASDHSIATIDNKRIGLLYAQDLRKKMWWQVISLPLKDEQYVDFISGMLEIFPQGIDVALRFSGIEFTPKLSAWLQKNNGLCSINLLELPSLKSKLNPRSPEPNSTESPINAASHSPQKSHTKTSSTPKSKKTKGLINSETLTHLQRLEAESIHIMREVVAEADNPVMLYSIGKDSAVMLHLALKAFHPAKLPFPLLHVDTRWKFQDMYAFREKMTQEHGFELITHINPDGVAQDINPFTHGSAIHTDIMKTQGLKQALDHHGFDVAFGGARRDEEKSRAKERIFSFRNSQHHWDPKQQRPEIWSLYNTKKHKGESIRVFPISNWTELDIWQYIYLENIPIVPLYFSKNRPVVYRDGAWIMVDDERMPLANSEVPQIKSVRFRTLGCYPLTGAVESTATTLPEIIKEMLLTKTSERQGRVIDKDGAASMEKKKQEGYF
jgi:sulfate adenylyltransferase subunit 2